MCLHSATKSAKVPLRHKIDTERGVVNGIYLIIMWLYLRLLFRECLFTRWKVYRLFRGILEKGNQSLIVSDVLVCIYFCVFIS